MPRPRPAASYVDYLPEFGRAVRIREFDRPMRSDDEETAQTIQFMSEIATADAEDAAVRSAALEALEDAGLAEHAPDIAKAEAVYWWLKRTIRYVPVPGTSRLVDQTLITPCTVLAMPEPIGDCPQFSMLAAAMFRVLCIPSHFVTIKAEETIPDQWSHVYNTVEVAPGHFMPFDASNGPEPGAEYARPFDRRVWPRIAPGRCSQRSKEHMHRITARRLPTMRNAALRGALGDIACDQDSNCYDTSAGVLVYSPPTDPTDTVLPGTYAGGYTPDVPSSTPSSSTPSWLQTVLTDATGLASQAIRASSQQKPYYITGPTGQAVLYNPNTGTVASGVSLGSLSPTVLIGGVLLLGLLFASGRK